MSEFISRQVVDRFQDNQLKSIIMAITSGILLTMYSTLYNFIEEDIDKSTILVLRGVYQVAIMFIVKLCTWAPLRPSLEPKEEEAANASKSWKDIHWKKLAIILAGCTALIGGIRLYLIFSALQGCPMGSVHSILQGSPIIAMILGHFFMNDKLTPLRGLCGVSLALGIVLISNPDTFTSVTEEVYIFLIFNL